MLFGASQSFRPIHGLAVWAMLPLTVWSGLPSTGCICPDGNFMLRCQRCLLGELRQNSMDCCQSALMPAGQHSCCRSEHRPTVGEDSSRQTEAFPSNGPQGGCTPVINAPFMRPSIVAAPLGQSGAFIGDSSVHVLTPRERSAGRLDNSPDLPTLDLAIEHRALRI